MENLQTKPNYINPKKDVISLERGKLPPQAIDLEQVVLAMDLCTKTQVKRYGGFGYDHLLDCVVPMLNTVGLTNEQIKVILVDNPARLLDSLEV